MRRLYAWVAGATGGLAAYRFLRRGRGTAGETPSQPATEPPVDADPRAEELRAKLAEKHAETAAADEPEPRGEPEAAESPDVDARRRDVHEHGRAAIDEMQGD